MAMRRGGRHSRRVVALVGAILALSLPANIEWTASGVTTSSLALRAVADRTGADPATLHVVDVSPVTYALQGRTLVGVKVLDRRNWQTHVVVMDQGRIVESEELDAAEASAYAAKFGRLDPALAATITQLPEAETLRVNIWLKERPYERPPRHAPGSAPTDEEVDRLLLLADQRRAEVVAATIAPVLGRLRDLGAEIESDSYAPSVFTTLSVEEIKRIAGWPEIDVVYAETPGKQLLGTARGTIRADAVQSLGYTGTGIRTAQVELGGGRVSTDHPNLVGVLQDPTYVCAGPAVHATIVAGIIRSTNATIKGIAPGSTHRAGGTCDYTHEKSSSRATAAADWGARAINLSFGFDGSLTPGSREKFYDGMVINRYRSVIVAAGNEAGTCESGTGNVLNPGLGYNVLTVGSFDDGSSATWTGDVMDPCSSFVDPTSVRGDREKPDLAAPGDNITSTSINGGFTTDGGTSLAAPMVTGAAALLMQRDNVLKEWPEGVRAILQATAFHNIEGDSRLSEKDGAGGMDVRKAYDAAAGTTGAGWNGTLYDCSDELAFTPQTMSLKKGQRTRVAIAWDNDPAYTSYSTRPSVDFDLFVLNPNGTQAAAAHTWDNTYEVVEFTPATDGNYQLKVSRTGCYYSPSTLAWAWHNGP